MRFWLSCIVAGCVLMAGLALGQSTEPQSTEPQSTEPSHTEEVIAGLSQNEVSITTTFQGSEIFIYGAVKREAPPSPGKLDIIITVTGPLRTINLRRKTREFGVWVNGDAVRVHNVPSFYALAMSRDFRSSLSWTDDLRYHIGLEQIIRLVDAPAWIENRSEIRDAISRIHRSEGLFDELPFAVKILQDTLFETRIRLPESVSEGNYHVRFFLIRDKGVVDSYEQNIQVGKVGLERWIFNFAHERPATYGVVAITIALAAGWLASAFFRTFFP